MTRDDIEAEVRALERQLPGGPSLVELAAVAVLALAGIAAVYWLWPVLLGGLALVAGFFILGAWATK